jgi:uncharacterized protein
MDENINNYPLQVQDKWQNILLTHDKFLNSKMRQTYPFWDKNSTWAKILNIEELEAQLDFKYFPSIAFCDIDEFKAVLDKGWQKFNQGQVLSEHLEFGKKFKGKIENSYLAKVSIRWWSENVGWGLFSEEDLECDAFIGEYTGIVRKNNEYNCLNNFLYEYPVPDYIDRSYVIDATSGNLIRFVNHSFTPNLKPTYAFYDGLYHLILIALKSIKKGEQLTYNYGKNYWYIRSQPQQFV